MRSPRSVSETRMPRSSRKRRVSHSSGRDDIVGASFTHEFDFVVSHLGSHCLLRDGKRSAKAAAFVRSFEIDELNTGDALKQFFRLGEFGVVYAFTH
jgi:hypothetical protein